MLKAWNTGHPGGIATVHANSAMSALYRIEGLVQEAVVTVPRRLIAEAIDIIVFISGRGLQRRIASMARVAGLDPFAPEVEEADEVFVEQEALLDVGVAVVEHLAEEGVEADR